MQSSEFLDESEIDKLAEVYQTTSDEARLTPSILLSELSEEEQERLARCLSDTDPLVLRECV